MSPTALGRYQVRSEIGRGNMGIVYRAYDPVIDRPVALKTVVLPESTSAEERETFLKRFFQEARTAGKLIHPNIVVTYDAATEEVTGTPFMAMELIEGESLSARLERDGRIDWRLSTDWVIALARALHQAHRQDIVHRDIKPANIMITSEGVPKITDFGIAKLATAHLTQTGVVIGTPYFMSPEQLRGDALDGRSDLFSLGALLYNLLCGRRPFEGTELASIASQVLYKNPPPVSDVVPSIPPSLDGVLARALTKNPEERYATGEELANDLVAVQQGKPPQRAVSLGERTQQSRPAAGTPPPIPSVAPAAVPAARADRIVAHFDNVWSSPRRRRTAVATALLLLIFSTTLLVREDLARWKLYFDAARAARNGKLELSEQRLEELVARYPDFESAAALLLEVSSDLVRPELPRELSAKHNHRFGSCDGRLTFREDGIEYGSKAHGRWPWSFQQIRALEAGGAWMFTVQTYEPEMLGLVTGKNYNFSRLGEPPDERFWTRYMRLFRRSVEAGGGS